MYFQALDDKKECVGVYYDGRLLFDELGFPESFENMKTWRYSGFLDEETVEYGWLRSSGKTLKESCPEHLMTELNRYEKKMSAYKKAFELGKIDFKQHCFFDLVPHDFYCHS